MTITVNAPNGAVVNFPDGTTTDTIKSVMAKNFGGPKSFGDKGRSWDRDVLPSLNAGLNRGADALLGLPGDIWHGARWLANRAIGYNDPINDILPTSESLRARREANVGPDYQPETTAGKYARRSANSFLGRLSRRRRASAKQLSNMASFLTLHRKRRGRRRKERCSSHTLELRPRSAADSRRLWSSAGGRRASPSSSHSPNRGGRTSRRAGCGTPSQILGRRRSTSRRPRRCNSRAPGWAKSFRVEANDGTTDRRSGRVGLERAFANENRTLYHETPMGQSPINRTPRDGRRWGKSTNRSADRCFRRDPRWARNIEADQDRAIQDALGKAQAASAGIGRGMTPEAQGAALRSALQSGRDAAKANERKLWAAIDPGGTLALPADPVTSAAGQISQSIPRTARPMSGEEAAIFHTAQNLPSIAPFNEMTALRSRISTAMREELRSAGQSPTYARLSQLRGAVKDAINNAAVHKSVVDDAAVAAGDMAEGESLRSRIGEL